MAICVAFFSPGPPSILMYIHEMGRIEAEPNGAALIAPLAFGTTELPSPPEVTTECPGRKGARCSATPIVPTPGPPPACPNTCIGGTNFGNDGECDDGGPGAKYSACAFGTDCEDCKKVSRNYGLVNEGRVRWCCQCAKKHKGVLLYQYFKQQAAKA